jgi:hypothetical protein
MTEIFDQIYKQDLDKVYDEDDEFTYGNIQWKGTDVCMDISCKCGHYGHMDAGVFYSYECPECKRKYAVGRTVKFIELITEEEKDYFDHYFTDHEEDGEIKEWD